MHRKAIAAASAAAGLFGAYLLGEMYREQHNFRVTRYEVHLGGGQCNAQPEPAKYSSRKRRQPKVSSGGQCAAGKRAAGHHAVRQERDRHHAEGCKKDAAQAQNSPSFGSASLRIVFLSDLHNHVYGKDNAPLLKAVQDENPDLILIGGDMLTAGQKYSEPYDRALSFVGQLPEIAPVYYACGNHEQRMKEHPEKYPQSFTAYKQALQNKGVIFLENESVCTSAAGRHLKITGLEIPLYAYRKFRKVSLDGDTVKACLNGEAANRTNSKSAEAKKTDAGPDIAATAEAKKADAGPDITATSAAQKEQVSPETESAEAQKENSSLEEKSAAAQEENSSLEEKSAAAQEENNSFADLCGVKSGNGQESLHILLAHNPVYMYAYKNIDADLILCGHLHGGIARLPGIGGVFSPQTFFFPKYSGEMTREEDRTIIVSKGLGAHTIKLRLWNYPEVVSICIA